MAIIEFNSKDEAVVAQTRDQKLIDENAIEVQVGSGSTLFVTNFPPTADEKYMRDLFCEVGPFILSAEWPVNFLTVRRDYRYPVPVAQI